MNGNNLFLDTNVVIYLFGGDRTLAELIDGKNIYLSFVTELELLSYPDISESESFKLRRFLSDCTVVDINSSIKESTIHLRQKYRLKLPDSIIVATAKYLDLPIITSDLAFSKIEELEIVIYETK